MKHFSKILKRHKQRFTKIHTCLQKPHIPENVDILSSSKLVHMSKIFKLKPFKLMKKPQLCESDKSETKLKIVLAKNASLGIFLKDWRLAELQNFELFQ